MNDTPFLVYHSTELDNIYYKGISETAGKDGTELIAEVEVLLFRGEQVPEDAMEIYNKYIGGV